MPHRAGFLDRAPLSLGLGVFVVVVSNVIGSHQGHLLGPLGYLLIVPPAFILLLRNRFPLTVFLTVAPLVWLYYGTGQPGGPAALYAILAVFNLSLRRGPLIAGSAAAGLLGAGVLAGLIAGQSLEDPRIGFAVAWSGMAVAAGAALAARRNSLAARREQAEERSRRLAEEERLRIAREVHDVVAHSLAMINVQAGVGAHVADRRPEEAKQALLAIKAASHTALEDLRATLAVLRSGEGRAPAPSLTRLADLTEATTAAGLPVQVEGEPGELPAPVDSAAYRIVQESLTNAVRHAKAVTGVTVRFARADGSIEIMVDDDGTGSVEPGSGNGLRGMRERAEALGGTLSAGPRAEGGFQVRARLPLGDT
ncbi:MAG TPA: sensor histidine kinase [Actinophytocola sp.]|uniref:sensor histidine kinase n=1 Tax=Actinophytocola sp. TaxID=1872138 RepID=UPI002E098424|nr:sensor histidine kinase [Actinophytocola sp.]